MTLEEFWGTKIPDKTSSEYTYAEAVWNAAREGMIPENEAIRIPHVSEWPNAAKSVVIYYSERDDIRGVLHDIGHLRFPESDMIKLIPRPTSKWTPKVGDKVFVLINIHQSVGVGEISEILTSGVRLKNDSLQWSIGSIKPFDVNKIGMRWEDI